MAITPEDAGRLFSGRVDFLLSAPALKFLPEPEVPEIAFCGRSNVGRRFQMYCSFCDAWASSRARRAR